MSKSIIIIGSGIAGLSAGCYGQMNGFATKIFEMHDKPGGLCTTWERKGYKFDNCIHWLIGSGKEKSNNDMWHELGALKDETVIDHDYFVKYKSKEDKCLILYNDANKLEKHLIEIAPEDTKEIKALTKTIRLFEKMSEPLPKENPNLLGRIKKVFSSIPFMLAIFKYKKITVEEFARRIKDLLLKEALPKVFYFGDIPMLMFVMTLAFLSAKNAGYIIGGSLDFSRSIEKRYLDLEGEINYKSKVEEILVEEDIAKGIRLADGSKYFADIIISAADGHHTIYELLKGKYVDEEISGYYDNLKIFEPLIQVFIGIDQDLSSIPHSAVFKLERPISIGGYKQDVFRYMHYCFDKTLTPAGKSIMVINFFSDYDYWGAMVEDRSRYDIEKKKIAEMTLDLIDSYVDITREKIEVIEVATPITYNRYTNNWKGAYQGWKATKETMKFSFGKPMKNTLPSLKSFYQIGQWVKPGGGLPTVAMSGKEIIQNICSKENIDFNINK